MLPYTRNDVMAAKDAQRRCNQTGRKLPEWYRMVLAAESERVERNRRNAERAGKVRYRFG